MMFRPFILASFFLTQVVYAQLPKPPMADYADGSRDWIEVGQSLGVKAGNLFLLLLGVAILGGVASGILRGYQAAQERQETSLFFKSVGVGIICAALGIGLLYSAHLMLANLS
jgi:hypothetical protein